MGSRDGLDVWEREGDGTVESTTGAVCQEEGEGSMSW